MASALRVPTGPVHADGLERFITLLFLVSSKIRNHLLQPFVNYKMERRETGPSHCSGTGWLTGVAGAWRCFANKKQERFGHFLSTPGGLLSGVMRGLRRGRGHEAKRGKAQPNRCREREMA